MNSNIAYSLGKVVSSHLMIVRTRNRISLFTIYGVLCDDPLNQPPKDFANRAQDIVVIPPFGKTGVTFYICPFSTIRTSKECLASLPPLHFPFDSQGPFTLTLILSSSTFSFNFLFVFPGIFATATHFYKYDIHHVGPLHSTPQSSLTSSLSSTQLFPLPVTLRIRSTHTNPSLTCHLDWAAHPLTFFYAAHRSVFCFDIRSPLSSSSSSPSPLIRLWDRFPYEQYTACESL
jgi:hypothetical protein